VGLVLENSLLNVAGHTDVEHAALAGEDVSVIDLGHIGSVSIRGYECCDGCHMEAVDFRGVLSDVILNGGDSRREGPYAG
jgi:hypothetical protein